MYRWWLLIIVSFVLGCNGEPPALPPETADVVPPLPALEIAADCNPLAADWDCLLPFPSDWFRVGGAVGYPDAALVHGPGGDPINPLIYAPDGHSIIPPIMALFPDGVDAKALIFHDEDVTATLRPGTPTLVLNAETGVPVLHFAEVDPNPENPRRRALFIRPMTRLDHATRYIVAISGVAVAPEAFRRIRDGLAAGDPVLEPLAQRYEAEIFPQLTAFGVDRGSLALAWDFTTQSAESATGDMLAVAAATSEPTVRVTSVEEDVDDFTFRRIRGTITAPSFMDSCEVGARLNRGASGSVTQNGTCEVEFLALIPHSVKDAGGPVRLLQFGHGFFGSRDEVEDYFNDLANQLSMVVIAIDWWGMSAMDLPPVVEALLNDPSRVAEFTDRVHQAMANLNAVTDAARGALLDEPAFQLDGAAAYDPQQIYFYGLSQGAILGGTFMALTRHIERGVLNVGSGAFSFVMFRSNSFQSYLALMQQQLPDPYDRQKYVALMQTVLDRIDPVTYGPLLKKQLLVQIGIGDSQTPNLGAHMHARSANLKVLQPAPRKIPGLAVVQPPTTESALVEFDYGIEPLPGYHMRVPEDQNDVHEAVRRSKEGISQIDAFLRPDGKIDHFCDGPCDPR